MDNGLRVGGKRPENRRDRWYSLLCLTENIGAFTDTRAY